MNTRFAFLLFVTACADFPGMGCAVSEPGTWPLPLGDTTQMRAGRVTRAQCQPSGDTTYAWHSSNSAVATISPTGLVRAVGPGLFDMIGVRGTDTIGAIGFVMPRTWQLRIEPKVDTVQIGDSIAFRVVAFDSSGKTYSFAPFTIYTPEFLQDTKELMESRRLSEGVRMSIVMPRVFGPDTAAAMLRGERAGTTDIIGEIGERRDTATLVVIPRRAQ